MNNKKTMIKVLHILPFLNKGGVEAFVMSYFRHIDREKFHFTFLILGDGNEYDFEIKSLGGQVIHGNIVLSKIKELSSNFKKLVRILRELDFDIIHSNVNQYNGLIFLASILAGKSHGFISHSHGTDFNEPCGHLPRRIIYNFLIPCLSRTLPQIRLACGEMAGKALYKKSVFEVLPNFVDLNFWNNVESMSVAELREELGIPEGARVYSSISRFDVNKNLIFAVKVYEQIIKREPNSFLILGGTPGETNETIGKYLRNSNLGEKVIVLGVCNNMRELYHLTDCYLMPSFHEGLPFSLIEAQACSLEIVASDSIDKTADVGLGLLHFLPLEAGPEKWAEIAMKCESHKSNRIELENSLKKKGFLVSDNVGRLESIYKELYAES